MRNKLRWPVTAKEDGQTAAGIMRHCLDMTKKEISRAKFTDMGITADGRQIRANTVLHTGNLLEVALEKEAAASTEPPIENAVLWQGPPVPILYEDEDVLIVNKPAGMAVHPVSLHKEGTLSQWAAWHLQGSAFDFTPRSIGRLDIGTSGAVLFAKSRAAAARLWQQKEKRQFSKTYLAIAEGHFDETAGTVRLPIQKADRCVRQRMLAAPDGKDAVTHYQVLSRLSDCDLVRLRLDTGRTHQIRVHMAALGHPLAGDDIYGGAPLPYLSRAALHAWKLEFLQPFCKEPRCVYAPLPADFLEKLKEEGMSYEAFNALLH